MPILEPRSVVYLISTEGNKIEEVYPGTGNVAQRLGLQAVRIITENATVRGIRSIKSETEDEGFHIVFEDNQQTETKRIPIQRDSEGKIDYKHFTNAVAAVTGRRANRIVLRDV